MPGNPLSSSAGGAIWVWFLSRSSAALELRLAPEQVFHSRFVLERLVGLRLILGEVLFQGGRMRRPAKSSLASMRQTRE